MRKLATYSLQIAGPGLVIYSPFAMAGVDAGARFLDDHYSEPDDVAASVRAGRLAGFCTGSPGNYNLRLLDGALDVPTIVRCSWWITLALEVRDGTVCVRDLFDFASWQPSCPPEQSLAMADGFYKVMVGTRPSDSGIVGDDQDIFIAFQRVAALPELTWEGVPFLGDEPED